MSDVVSEKFRWRVRYWGPLGGALDDAPVYLNTATKDMRVTLGDWLSPQQAVQLGTQITQAGLRAAARQRAEAKLAAECEQSNQNAQSVCDAVDHVMGVAV